MKQIKLRVAILVGAALVGTIVYLLYGVLATTNSTQVGKARQEVALSRATDASTEDYSRIHDALVATTREEVDQPQALAQPMQQPQLKVVVTDRDSGARVAAVRVRVWCDSSYLGSCKTNDGGEGSIVPGRRITPGDIVVVRSEDSSGRYWASYGQHAVPGDHTIAVKIRRANGSAQMLLVDSVTGEPVPDFDVLQESSDGELEGARFTSDVAGLLVVDPGWQALLMVDDCVGWAIRGGGAAWQSMSLQRPTDGSEISEVSLDVGPTFHLELVGEDEGLFEAWGALVLPASVSPAFDPPTARVRRRSVGQPWIRFPSIPSIDATADNEAWLEVASGEKVGRARVSLQPGIYPTVVTMDLVKSATLGGVVTSEGGHEVTGGVVVTCLEGLGSVGYGRKHVDLNAQGEFVLRGVFPGRYQVQFTNVMFGASVEVITVGSGDSKWVELQPSLPSGGPVAGAVWSSTQSQSFEDSSVVLWRTSAGAPTLLVAVLVPTEHDRGVFRFAHVPDGVYELRVYIGEEPLEGAKPKAVTPGISPPDEAILIEVE